mgnify:CR=1 FL=1
MADDATTLIHVTVTDNSTGVAGDVTLGNSILSANVGTDASAAVTSLGSMVTYVAIPFQVAELTDSFLAVGLIGLAELVPLVIFGLYGGSLADRIDRRILIVGELGEGRCIGPGRTASASTCSRHWPRSDLGGDGTALTDAEAAKRYAGENRGCSTPLR